MEETEILDDYGPNHTDYEWSLDNSSGTGHYTSVELHSNRTLRILAKHAVLYVAPALVALGLLGNLSSFLLLVLSRLRHFSRTVYLAAMCLADQSLLIVVVVSTRTMADVDLHGEVDSICKLLAYIVHILDVGKMFVVLMMLDTFTAVCHVGLADCVCRAKSALAAAAGVTAVVAIYSTHAVTEVKTMRAGEFGFCVYHDYDKTSRLHVTDITLLSVLPAIVLLVLCVVTCVHKRRSASRCTTGFPPQPLVPQRATPHNAVDAEREAVAGAAGAGAEDDAAIVHLRASSSLELPVATCVLYYLTLLPVSALHCVILYGFMQPGSLSFNHTNFFLIQQIIHVWSYLFFTIKAVLCVSCWQPYRQTLVSCCKDLWHRRLKLCGKVPYTAYQEEVGMTTVS